MNVTLTPELEKLIDQKVASGQYPSRDAVVQAALEMLRVQETAEDRLETLLDEAESERDGIELTPQVRSDIEQRAAAALRDNKPA
jgi:putative addiction module CopG family antidote